MAVSIQFITSGIEQIEAASTRVDRALDGVGRSIDRHVRVLERTKDKVKDIGRDFLKNTGKSVGGVALGAGIGSAAAGGDSFGDMAIRGAATLAGSTAGGYIGGALGGIAGIPFGPGGVALGAKVGAWVGVGVGAGVGNMLGNALTDEEKDKAEYEGVGYRPSNPQFARDEKKRDKRTTFEKVTSALSIGIDRTLTNFVNERLDAGYVSPENLAAMRDAAAEERQIRIERATIGQTNRDHAALIASRNRSTFKKPSETAY